MAEVADTRAGAASPTAMWHEWRDSIEESPESRKAWHRGGSGTPMVLIHGLSDTWRTWQPLLPRLEANHDVLALTLPGHLHGMPLPEVDEISAGVLADVVEAEMERAGWDRAHLVGNSLGGWLALELAARGRGLSAVALCPAGGFERGSRVERRIQRVFAESHRSAKRAAPRANILVRLPGARAIGLRPFVSRPRRVPTDFYAHWIRGMAACEAVHLALDMLATTGFVEELGPINCPVRIAFGARDRIVDPVDGSPRLRRMVPTAEFMVLPEVGHVPMWDDPDLVAATILEVSTQAQVSPVPTRATATLVGA